MARDRASRPEAKPHRLFVAVDVPADVHTAVEVASSSLRERWPNARWVPTANQHLTLKFLGATWPRLVGWVSATVRDVAAEHEPFEVRFAGLGAFPSVHRARVLWAGLEDPGSRLTRIAGDLEASLAREFPAETRPFTPHLTLARFEPPVSCGAALGDAAMVADGWFVVRELVVYRSHLRRPAPLYERVGTAPLGGVAAA